MAPTNVCISHQPPAVYLDQYSSFAGSMPRDAASPKGCGFKAWANVTPGSAEQRPTILFQLLQHDDLSGDEFQQMERTGNASKVEVDDRVLRIRPNPSAKHSRSFSASAESTRMTLTDDSRSPSQDSVASSDNGALEDGLPQQLRPRQRPRAESFLESTRAQLLSLTTRCSPFEWVEDDGFKEHPVPQDTCSAPSAAATQSSPHTTRRRSASKLCPSSRIDLGAIDLTCKRRCSRDSDVTWDASRKSSISKVSEIAKETVGTNGTAISKEQHTSLREPDTYAESDTSREPGCSGDRYKFRLEPGCTVESPLKTDRRRCCKDADQRSEETSILKSILTGRSRSQSFSGAVTKLPVGQHGCVSMAAGHQRVALAKRNMMPILARIADRLSGAVGFSRSLPEFLQFPEEDQALLLVQACPRLLLLYLAEDNFQFAVTPVRSAVDPEAKPDTEEPTMQFVETVQNFIGKCQTQAIGATEYFYMRMIVLFHTGTSINLLIKRLEAPWHRALYHLLCLCR